MTLKHCAAELCAGSVQNIFYKNLIEMFHVIDNNNFLSQFEEDEY